MIHQITSVSPNSSSAKKAPRTRLNQSKSKNRSIDTTELDSGVLWSPITSGPYVVPIIRWIE